MLPRPSGTGRWISAGWAALPPLWPGSSTTTARPRPASRRRRRGTGRSRGRRGRRGRWTRRRRWTGRGTARTRCGSRPPAHPASASDPAATSAMIVGPWDVRCAGAPRVRAGLAIMGRQRSGQAATGAHGPTFARLRWRPEPVCGPPPGDARSSLVQPGMPDMSMLLQQVQQMQEEMSAAEVTGQAGNGLVEITMTAPLQTSGLEIRRVRIDPKVVDPDDVDTLQDLIVGALEDAVAKAAAAPAAEDGPAGGRPGPARPGLDAVFEGPVQDLIDELGRLPGVGPKSAQRIAFHLLAADPVDVTRLQDVLQKVKDGVALLRGLRQRLRARTLPLLRGHPARPHRRVRRRGAQGRARGRAHPRVQGPLPRARRRARPAGRRRPRRACASASCWPASAAPARRRTRRRSPR